METAEIKVAKVKAQVEDVLPEAKIARRMIRLLSQVPVEIRASVIEIVCHNVNRRERVTYGELAEPSNE